MIYKLIQDSHKSQLKQLFKEICPIEIHEADDETPKKIIDTAQSTHQ